ncbi:MAG: BPL-N domain-containing protein [Alphaproteobacteria bacterium]|nr:BPL-N domain-containing protein [Alphaproteobacteria bacterium]
MRNKILIYADYGCSNVSTLENGLREYFEPRRCMVGLPDAAGIISRNELNENVLAFFMPGGAGTPFRRKLEVQGNGKIRDYVRNGGIIAEFVPEHIMPAAGQFLKLIFLN